MGIENKVLSRSMDTMCTFNLIRFMTLYMHGVFFQLINLLNLFKINMVFFLVSFLFLVKMCERNSLFCGILHTITLFWSSFIISFETISVFFPDKGWNELIFSKRSSFKSKLSPLETRSKINLYFVCLCQLFTTLAWKGS